MTLLRRLLRGPLHRLTAHRTPTARDALGAAIAELLESPSLGEEQKGWLGRVSPRISAGDQMFVENEADHYLGVGLSALENIGQALEACGDSPPSIRRVLDFPCGYGRVLRFLKARFPEARFVGCELQPQAVDFCRRELGVETAPSDPDFAKIGLGRSFDLIWCGSLVTHLDAASTEALLACFDRHLADGGLAIFTTHGKAAEDLLRTEERSYSLSPEGQARVLAGFDETGYGFAEYEDWPGYGISLTSPEAIRRLAAAASEGRWAEVFYRCRGWDGHQDVFAFRKPGR